MSASDITAVIVTYNSKKTIKQCLESVIKNSSGTRIIIVDNNSSDATVSSIEGFSGQALLIQSKTNLGFSKANNLGFAQVHTQYVVFLNPDATLETPSGFLKLSSYLEKMPDYGIIGPRLVSEGIVQKSVRKLPSLAGALKEYIFRIPGSYDFYEPNCCDICDVESVVGACMMMRSGDFKKLGGFNERYFLYYEDLDLCRKAKAANQKIGFVPSVSVSHVVGASGASQDMTPINRSSARKYHGITKYLLIELVLYCSRFIKKTNG